MSNKKNNEKKKNSKPLILTWDTMPGRKFRVTAIDKRLHEGTEGFRDPHPFSPHAIKKGDKDIPY